MDRKKILSNTTTVLLGVGIVSAILTICFFVFHLPDFWPQLLAIIASAFLGAGATAWITNTLLKNQQESEEAKEKNIKVYENKIKVYSAFISKMWKTLEDDAITDEEIRGIRSDIFNKLVFYLKKEDVIILGEKVKNIKSSDSFSNEEDAKEAAKKTQNIITCFSEITELLRADVNNNNMASTPEDISKLWNNFGVQPRESNQTGLTEEKIVKAPNEPTIEISETHIINPNYWHFNMWGDEQIESFRNGLYELSLMEYEETWRTNLVQQVQYDDIVFLFRRGGWGYIGAFRVKGWRVFFNDESGVSETVYLDGNKPFEVTNATQVNEDIDHYDIYKSISDSATSCANLIVEPFAFDYEGVSYPGGVYRRTISRYDSDYARALLSRFLANKDKASFNMLWDEKDGQKGYITKVNSNSKYFEKIISDLNIAPAEKDENGYWV